MLSLRIWFERLPGDSWIRVGVDSLRGLPTWRSRPRDRLIDNFRGLLLVAAFVPAAIGVGVSGEVPKIGNVPTSVTRLVAIALGLLALAWLIGYVSRPPYARMSRHDGKDRPPPQHQGGR